MPVKIQNQVPTSWDEFVKYAEEFTNRMYERDSSAARRSLRNVEDFFNQTEEEIEHIIILQEILRSRGYTQSSQEESEDEFAPYADELSDDDSTTSSFEEIQNVNLIQGMLTDSLFDMILGS